VFRRVLAFVGAGFAYEPPTFFFSFPVSAAGSLPEAAESVKVGGGTRRVVQQQVLFLTN
jgi:hypothetical protein